MKITIGALVLCKVLISDPSMNKVDLNSTPNPTEQQTTQATQFNSAIEQVEYNESLSKISKQPRIRDSQSGQVYTMIEGQVQDIQSYEFYAPVGNTGKFTKAKEVDLVIKSNEIDYLVISSKACGVLTDMMYKEPTKEEILAKKEAQKKQQEAKNELIVVPGSEVPEGYEIVELDEATKEDINSKRKQNIVNQELAKKEKFLKDLEHDQSRFIKEQNSKEELTVHQKIFGLGETNSPKDVPIIEKKLEGPKDIVQVDKTEKKELDSKDLFELWEREERIKKLEKERKETRAQLEAQEKKNIELEEKRIALREKQAEKDKKESERKEKQKIQNEILAKEKDLESSKSKFDSSDKSLLKDAFKVITRE